MHYVAGLDGLRAIAALVVLAFHLHAPGTGSGYLGVDVFFVLSGYLITRLLAGEYQRAGGIALRRFYFNRLLRLYPTLLLVVAAFLSVAPYTWPELPYGTHALLSVLYLTDYSRAFWGMPTVLSHTWSLSVEEHFYLLWPILLPFMLRTRRPALTIGCLYVAATVWRWGNAHWLGWDATYFRFDTRLSGLLLGSLLALLPKLMLSAKYWRLSSIALVLVMALPSFRQPAGITWPVLVAEWATVSIIAACVHGASPRILQAPLLAYLGKLSYGIYLWHLPIVHYIHATKPGLATLPIVTTLSIAFAAMTYHCVDVPLKAKRLRAINQPARTLPATSRTETTRQPNEC